MTRGQRVRFYLRAASMGVCLLICTGTLGALTDEEHLRQLQLSFTEVGGRALAMGGAYVSLASDATASDANPAGLYVLRAPRLYLETGGRYYDGSSVRSRRGSTEVNPVTGERNQPFLELSSTSEPEAMNEPVFAGFSWPFRLGRTGRALTVTGSRQVFSSQDLSLPSGGGATSARFAFDAFPNTVSGGKVVAYSINAPVTGSLSSEIVHWNASVAAEVHADFSVGVTLVYATLDFDSDSETTVVDPLQILVDRSHPRLPGQTDTDVYRTHANGSDEDFTYTVGIHWHPGTAFGKGVSPWQFGASFRRGATFGIEQSTVLNGVPDRSFEFRLAVPDQFAVGASYRRGSRWLFSGEIERVEYSTLLERYQAGVNYLTSPLLASGAFSTGASRSIQYRLNDGNVYRLGLEYVLPLRAPSQRGLSLRAGWFLTPDLSIRMERFNSTDRAINQTYRKAFPGGDSESHFTAGVGWDLGAYSFSLAAEFSDVGDRILATFEHSWDWGNP